MVSTVLRLGWEIADFRRSGRSDARSSDTTKPSLVSVRAIPAVGLTLAAKPAPPAAEAKGTATALSAFRSIAES
eukprot:5369436-Pleurochrysis_carterae.AAC.1